MRRFSTLMTAVAVFFVVQANAQNYSENFETNFSGGGHGCWNINDMLYAVRNPPKDYVISGNGSAYIEPPTSASQLRVFGTPYLSLGTSVTIAFDYMLTSKLSTGAYRTIEVGLVDANGAFAPLAPSFNVADNTAPVNYSRTFTLPSATIARVAIRFTGSADGNSRVAIDNVSINAPMYNGGVCNTTPIALPNTYYPMLATNVVTGNVMTDNTGNDSDPDGGILTATLTSSILPTVGVLTFNPDGSFSFTPSATFTGGPVTFTYRVTDDGYPRASATTTVTFEYPALSTLPVKLINFAGSTANNKAQLRWSVADNETGDHFQVLRSADGKNFTETGVVFINGKVGAESYTFADKTDLDAATYYKLKVVNKDKSVSYSNVIILKNATTKSATGVSILKNPVESTVTFTYTASTATQSNVAIYNASGVKVYSSRLSSQKGINAVSLPLDSHMAAGTYILEVTNGAERMVTKLLKK